MLTESSSSGPLLGIDLGLARTGLALCDAGMKVAFPIGVLEGTVRGIGEDLERICREREARGVVLGLPRHMDGREGDLAPKVRRVARKLHRSLGVPIWLWDERLTTAEVERRAREAGGGSRPKDDLAATLILQGFLDAEAWTREPFLSPPSAEREKGEFD